MNVHSVNVYEAKTQLSRLLDRASRGEEIIIAKAGKPVARLVALESSRARTPGIWAGRVDMADDFDVLTEQDERDWYGA